MWASLLSLLTGLLHSIMGQHQAKQRGEAEAERDEALSDIENIEEANKIRDRLRTDPDYADSLRDQFRR